MTGTFSTARGRAALRSNTTGTDNTANGAAALGLERSHLYRKMKSLGISPAEP